MAAVTKLELQQLLATRNAECEALRVRVAELEGDVAARDARLAKAVGTFRGMRTAAPAAPVAGERVVQRWTDRQGQAWMKVQVGYNRCAIRRVEA